MATLLRIDELNKPFNSDEYMLNYFAVMLISQLRKDMRLSAAKDIREVILLVYTLIDTMQTYGEVDWNYVETQFRDEFGKVVVEHSRNNQDIQNFIDEKTEDFMRITRENLASDPYWTSDERATMEAVNDANTVIGYEEWQEAMDDGMLYKVWVTENDSRVRPTHRKVDMVKIPIGDMFEVGDGVMRYPHDWYYNPKECYNCRCALTFK